MKPYARHAPNGFLWKVPAQGAPVLPSCYSVSVGASAVGDHLPRRRSRERLSAKRGPCGAERIDGAEGDAGHTHLLTLLTPNYSYPHLRSRPTWVTRPTLLPTWRGNSRRKVTADARPHPEVYNDRGNRPPLLAWS